MRKLLVWTGTLLLLTVLGLGTWWAWPLWFPSLPGDWLSTLAKVDAALVQNQPDQAKLLLDPAPKALPVSGWLQWEKRVSAVAQRTGDWAWAGSQAALAQSQYPGNADLTAFFVWALLQNQKADQALVVAEKVLSGTAWESLVDQARVEAAGLASGDWSVLRERLGRLDPPDVKLYDRLATVVPAPEVRKNALLVSLADGRLDLARNYLSALSPEQRDVPPFDRLQGLMAYDLGDWSRAAALLKSLSQGRPENLMVLADVYLHLGDAGQARLIYDQLLADQPDDFPLALGVNRASLALDLGEPSLALRLLEKVSTLYPDEGSGVTRLLVLEARFAAGESDAVRAVLDRLVSEGDESSLALQAELLRGKLFPDTNAIPRLWSLIHRHPDFGPLAERLAWSLLVQQDFTGVYHVLGPYESAVQKKGDELPWWTSFLRGLALGTQNRLEEASNVLAVVPAPWRDAVYYADFSLVSQVRAQQADPEAREPLLNTALDNLDKALDLLPAGSAPSSLHRRSLWLTRRGELQLALLPFETPAQRGTLRSEATGDFRQAVQLDPDNLRASFLLRQALATIQEKS